MKIVNLLKRVKMKSWVMFYILSAIVAIHGGLAQWAWTKQ